MELDQEICGACLRPRDEAEIEKGHELIRRRAELRRRRPYVIARGVSAAAALLLAYHFRGIFQERLKSWHADYLQAMADAERPMPSHAVSSPTEVKSVSTPPRKEGAAPTAAPPVPLAATAPASETSQLQPPPATPAPAPVATPPSEPSIPPQPSEICVYGVVYDLKTLRPVPYAFVRVGQNVRQTQTDANGYYRLDILPSADGAYSLISVKAPGYRNGQLEDPDPSFLQRSLKDRLQAISELAPADLEDVPLRYPPRAQFVSLNLALVPEEAETANRAEAP